MISYGRFVSLAAVTLSACATTGGSTFRGPVSDSSCREAYAVNVDSTIDYASNPNAMPRLVSRTAPHYPDSLRASEVSGRAVVSFAIDTLGFVIHNSARVVSASRHEFGDAVCTWLRYAHYERTFRGGHPIVVGVQNLPTTFELTR